jgi:hypothetical protein
MQVSDEDAGKPGEVEPGVGIAGRRAAAAVDHEHPAIDGQRG